MITAKFINNCIFEAVTSYSPSKLADEITRRYGNEDFKDVIDNVSERTGLSRVKLIQIFCDQIGADIGNLPGSYSLKDFVKKPEPLGKGEKPPPVTTIPLLFSKGAGG